MPAQPCDLCDTKRVTQANVAAHNIACAEHGERSYPNKDRP